MSLASDRVPLLQLCNLKPFHTALYVLALHRIREPLNKAELTLQRLDTIELNEEENSFNQGFLRIKINNTLNKSIQSNISTLLY